MQDCTYADELGKCFAVLGFVVAGDVGAAAAGEQAARIARVDEGVELAHLLEVF